MIISASYRTDIPAFYGQWFMNRLRAGCCMMTNSYNGKPIRVSLAPNTVDGFVFWTKNIGPFLRHLPEIKQQGYPFMVQHTINGYPRQLESRVMRPTRTVEHVKRLADTYGPDVVVWRYDPILLTSLTPPDWHRQRFAWLAHALEGTTDEVVISFARIYKKTQRNLVLAAHEDAEFDWSQHERTSLEDRRALLADLAAIAKAHGMRMAVCSQHDYVVDGVTEEARCVDAARMDRIARRFGRGETSLAGRIKLKGNRAECGCYESRDIGEYDTCPHGCIYCYAVRERDLAVRRYHEHDPSGEFLFKPKGDVAATGQPPESVQGRLF
jgi:Domain of unknown function (DUF1848)